MHIIVSVCTWMRLLAPGRPGRPHSFWYTSHFTERVTAKCRFPHFLREPLPDGSPRYWLTEMNYLGNSDKMSSRLEISAKESKLEAWITIQEPCDDPQGTRSYCDYKQLDYTRHCVREDGVGKYRVRHEQHKYV